MEPPPPPKHTPANRAGRDHPSKEDKSWNPQVRTKSPQEKTEPK
jgi:hypothetical protein